MSVVLMGSPLSVMEPAKRSSCVPDVCSELPSLFIPQNRNVFSNQGDRTQSGKTYETVFLNHNLFYLHYCENIVDDSL